MNDENYDKLIGAGNYFNDVDDPDDVGVPRIVCVYHIFILTRHSGALCFTIFHGLSAFSCRFQQRVLMAILVYQPPGGRQGDMAATLYLGHRVKYFFVFHLKITFDSIMY